MVSAAAIAERYPGRIGTFAVVKLWPGAKVAEDEVIARLKVAAKKLGLRCIEIAADGRMIEPPKTIVTGKDVDFVLHLHFETPKAYDAFSFVALWNPLQFYYDYQHGKYRQYAENIASHDDALSCDSHGADAQYERLIAHDATRLPPLFKLYHSLADPIIAPRPGIKKLFYTGINWEKLGKGKSRHQALLELLDETGDLKIYGPRSLYGVKLWDDFKSYIGPLPFDGISVVKEIADAGIVLALSSEAHKDAEMMSNRLFEGLAAGAVVISDENPFARRHFGDALLYIDSSLPTDEVFTQIRQHLQWMRTHDAEAVALAQKAQAIFKERYTLDASLDTLYRGLPARKQALQVRIPATATIPEVEICYLMPEYDSDLLETMLDSSEAQTYPALRFTLLIDKGEEARHHKRLSALLGKRTVAFDIRPIPFFKNYIDSTGRGTVRLGRIVYDHLQDCNGHALVCYVSPGERIFSDHIETLVSALMQGGAACHAAYARLVRLPDSVERQEITVSDGLQLLAGARQGVTSFGRYLIRTPERIDRYRAILPYLNRKAVSFLAYQQQAVATRRVTVTCQEETAEEGKGWELEDEILMDFIPRDQWPSLKESAEQTAALEPMHLSLRNLSQINKLQLVKDLYLALPLPGFLRSMTFGFYHRLKRR